MGPAYDFHNLSYFEFELLVRDLLQADWSVRLESFAAGRDRGIDLRYARADDGVTIIQCKHWRRSGFRKLLKELTDRERPKIEALSPERYVLATSVPMTGDRKAAILEALDPFIRDEQDVLGLEDLNNLLSKHDRVERQHLKLWLASTTVLQAIVNSDVYSRSREFAEVLQQGLPLYVQNVSFTEAMDILEKHRVCVVAGIPGIGKTMLGDVLVAAHISNGYEPIVISGDVEEAWRVFDSEAKQVFYYDDFLGQTSFREKFEKNEEARLIEFMAAVARRPSKRFILTTREYILQQATTEYEKLRRVNEDFSKLIIDLEDYTRLDRARILYNHLYFSDIETAVIVGALRDKRYLTIIAHKNYNPRLIQAVTKLASREDSLDADAFYEFFIRNLDNPAEIWSHAFRNQLSSHSRALLLLMLSLPRRVLLRELDAAATEYFDRRLGSARGTYDVVELLRQLEGNFCAIEPAGLDHLVSFHNPSIRDYLRNFLNARRDEYLALLESALYVDQVQLLLEYAAEADDGGTSAIKLSTLRQDAIAACVRTYRAPACTPYVSIGHAHIPMEDRLARIIGLLDAEDTTTLSFVRETAREVARSWDESRGDKDATLRLLQAVVRVPALRDELELLQSSAKRWFMFSQSNADDYGRVIGFRSTLPEMVSDDEFDALRDEFLEWAPAEAEAIIDEATDSGTLEHEISQISAVAEEFGLDPSAVIDDFAYMRRLEQLDYEPDPDDIPWSPPAAGSAASPEAEQIDALFDAMRERE